MSIDEQQLRHHLASAPVPGALDAEAVIADGHRRLRARRRRRALGAAVPAVVIAVASGAVLSGTGGTTYEFVGSGLTLAADQRGPVQVDEDRVDLGGGLQAWRDDEVLSLGYPGGAHATLDTTDPTAQWGDLGYDVVVLDAEGEDDGRTTVVGTVHGAPSRVEVTIAGVSDEATIACFTQAPGWCSYAATVPYAVQDYDTQPTTVRIS